MFPYYLSIGMSYEQFWEQDCELVRYYREAARIKRELDNQNRWLQGMYVYEALCCVAPVLHAFAKKDTKPIPYRSEPYTLEYGGRGSDKTKAKKKLQESSDKKAKDFFEMFMISHNKKFDREEVG